LSAYKHGQDAVMSSKSNEIEIEKEDKNILILVCIYDLLMQAECMSTRTWYSSKGGAGCAL